MAERQNDSLNPFESPAIGLLLKTPVKPKRNREKPFQVRSYIEKAVDPRIPEVMVKIKRGGKTASHLMAHLEYITRNGKLEGETERGEIVKGKSHLKEVLTEWTSDAESIRPGARNSINAIFSMPPGTDPQAVKNAVRIFAKQELANYQYVFVLHTDDDHPHCHICIKTLGLDGRKLDPRKDDIQLWRDVFAEKLNELGIPAKATYRAMRGIVEKRMSMAQYKAKHDRKNERGIYTFETRVRNAAVAATTIGGAVPVWESASPRKKDLLAEQTQVRSAWHDLERQLRVSGEEADQRLADQIRKFFAAMPAPLTQHQRLTAQLAALHRDTRAQRKSEDEKGTERTKADGSGRSR